MPKINCTFCGALVYRRPSRLKKHKIPFCNRACRGAYDSAYDKSLRPTVTCAHCGAAISESPSRRKGPLAFCNSACYGSYRRTGCIHPNGYRYFTINYKVISEHRFVMEQHLGRKLLPSEHVHHRDHDGLNNSLSNLVVLDAIAHNREHHPLTWDLERAKAMRAEGRNFREIGRALGIDGTCIREAFTRRGLHVPRQASKKPR